MEDNTTSTVSSNISEESPAAVVRFVVTGFGPFRGVSCNPTQVIVESLVAYLQQQQQQQQQQQEQAAEDPSWIFNNSTVRTRIIETSAQAAQSEIKDIYHELQLEAAVASKSSSNNNNVEFIVLHLGVNQQGGMFQLETFAYNEATFEVKDEQGVQLMNQPVLVTSDVHNLGAALKTDFDIPKLVTLLNNNSLVAAENDLKSVSSSRAGKDMSTHYVMESTDPGRFVCNYTYCLSLENCRRCHSLHAAEPNNNNSFRCIFLHVPSFDVIPKQKQLEFVVLLMHELRLQALSKRCDG